MKTHVTWSDMYADDPFSDPRLGSQRADQKERTRLSIVAAAMALMYQGGEDEVTMRAVARMVGITERTVHRHFRTRDLLLQEVWKCRQDPGLHPFAQTADALIESPRRLFRQLEEQGNATLTPRETPVEDATALGSGGERQRAMLKCVRDEFNEWELDEPSLRRRAAIAELIASSYAWELMRRQWGFDAQEAGEAAAEAIAILLGRRIAC